MRPVRIAILPAPACDLLDRLTRDLDIPLTLTDHQGTVVASTAGIRAGEGDPLAAATPADGDAGVSRREGGSAPRVYVPVDLAGQRAGTLIAYGDPSWVEIPARIAAVAIGLALDFAEAASALGHASVSPGWLLYLLLRGSFAEAQQARSMASILGWELFVQRVALVVEVRPTSGQTPISTAATMEMLDRLVGGPGPVPYGQIGENEWVILIHHEPGMPWQRIRELAVAIRRELAWGGAEVAVGVGEPHLPVQPVSALRRSYREASYALRLGSQLSGGAGLFELRSLGPAAFFAPSAPSRRRLAAHILDPLEAHAGLAETLTAFLALDMSVAATADMLGLHRHTVRNHLERVSDLTGLDPRSLDGAVQLKLALLVAAADPDRGSR